MNIIKNQYKEYDEDKLDEIRYGLEGIYLTISKLVIIFCISLLLNMVKEFLILLILFNGIRCVSFGMHAKNSLVCLLSSTFVFICLPIICKYIFINKKIKILLSMPIVICIFLFSPADTEKRPIVSKKRRNIYKTISTIVSVFYMTLSIIIENNYLSNAFIASLLIQIFLINPMSYKLFNTKYNNYKDYVLNEKKA